MYEFDVCYTVYGELLVQFRHARSAVRSLHVIDCDAPIDYRFDDAGNLWRIKQ